ncbi:hypothetical protein HPB52_003225 [Rhipicephalus sanguineus]|uniref:Uncharacterized protein n=1 Tax=Rhipicephalus sanguineus TaxID=34632 RepID=A0A9D4T557_RHISA|nr:hypothetical protein HPB52_003225 [Rhipicephalus sanguineus]
MLKFTVAALVLAAIIGTHSEDLFRDCLRNPTEVVPGRCVFVPVSDLRDHETYFMLAKSVLRRHTYQSPDKHLNAVLRLIVSAIEPPERLNSGTFIRVEFLTAQSNCRGPVFYSASFCKPVTNKANQHAKKDSAYVTPDCLRNPTEVVPGRCVFVPVSDLRDHETYIMLAKSVLRRHTYQSPDKHLNAVLRLNRSQSRCVFVPVSDLRDHETYIMLAKSVLRRHTYQSPDKHLNAVLRLNRVAIEPPERLNSGTFIRVEFLTAQSNCRGPVFYSASFCKPVTNKSVLRRHTYQSPDKHLNAVLRLNRVAIEPPERLNSGTFIRVEFLTAQSNCRGPVFYSASFCKPVTNKANQHAKKDSAYVTPWYAHAPGETDEDST